MQWPSATLGTPRVRTGELLMRLAAGCTIRSNERTCRPLNSSCTSRRDGELTAEGRAAREGNCASKDLARNECLEMPESSTASRSEHSAASKANLTSWGPTFDMSGGAKGAKRPLERPLDGRVRRLAPHPSTCLFSRTNSSISRITRLAMSGVILPQLAPCAASFR